MADVVPLPYNDFSITIDNDQSLEARYTLNGEKSKLVGRLGFDMLTKLNIERLNASVNLALKQQEESGRPNSMDADLKVLGLNLHRVLLGDENIRKCFDDVRKEFQRDRARDRARRLRLRLRLVFGRGAESISRLPWEFLFIPGDPNPLDGFFFTGQSTELILTRHVPPSDLVEGLGDTESANLRILVAVSTPAGEGDIKTPELQELLTQIRQMPLQQLEWLEDEHCTTDEFQAKLKDFQPHIVHFIGHGKEGQLAFIKKMTDPDYKNGEGLQARWVPAKRLGGMIANCNPRPRLVFLHACKGAAATSNDTFNSCARELVFADVPAVIAMQYNISNEDAALFAKIFYQAIGQGSDIDDAVKLGRLALGNSYPMWEHARFGTPVVYLQTDVPIVQRAREQPAKAYPVPGDANAATTPLSRIASAGAPSNQRPSAETAAAPAIVRGPGRTHFEG